MMCTQAEVALRVVIDSLETETTFERHRIEIGHLYMIENDESQTEVNLPDTFAGAVLRIDFIYATLGFRILPEQIIQVKIVEGEIALRAGKNVGDDDV